MRRLVTTSLLLFAAACTNKRAALPTPGTVAPARSTESGDLIGLSSSQLSQRFGQPDLQVREASSVKLQFRGRTCILDAYLYPERTGGIQKVTHVDTRDRDGGDTDQDGCIEALQRR
jgi:hypothetical protein